MKQQSVTGRLYCSWLDFDAGGIVWVFSMNQDTSIAIANKIIAARGGWCDDCVLGDESGATPYPLNFGESLASIAAHLLVDVSINSYLVLSVSNE